MYPLRRRKRHTEIGRRRGPAGRKDHCEAARVDIPQSHRTAAFQQLNEQSLARGRCGYWGDHAVRPSKEKVPECLVILIENADGRVVCADAFACHVAQALQQPFRFPF